MNSESDTKMEIDCNGTTPADQYADAVAAHRHLGLAMEVLDMER